MEAVNQSAGHKVYTDPTKPVIPPIHKKKSVAWILFIAINISIPILFLIAIAWMNSQ